LKGLTLRSYYIELLRSLNNNFSIKTCVDLAILIGRIKCQSKVLGNIISKLPNQDIVCYTFWFRNETSALAQIPKRNFKLITRAHGADVYIERSKLNLYYREQTLANLDKVFCVSEAGKRYLQDQFPKYKDKFVTRYLGSVPHDFKSEHSDESNTIRFVSCSSVIGLKRVDLIFEFLSTLANLKSQYRIVWNHIGDGELMDSLKQMTESKPENIEVHFHGHKENRLILEFYRDNKIDLFIHLSSTEGLPVVIMEALSFGIPVIATDVGGVSEIVNSKTGYLLSQNPSFEEVLEKVNDYLALSPDQTKNMRSAIRHFWLDKLNAETNARSHISSFK